MTEIIQYIEKGSIVVLLSIVCFKLYQALLKTNQQKDEQSKDIIELTTIFEEKTSKTLEESIEESKKFKEDFTKEFNSFKESIIKKLDEAEKSTSTVKGKIDNVEKDISTLKEQVTTLSCNKESFEFIKEKLNKDVDNILQLLEKNK